jgi:hypothetical protein
MLEEEAVYRTTMKTAHTVCEVSDRGTCDELVLTIASRRDATHLGLGMTARYGFATPDVR